MARLAPTTSSGHGVRDTIFLLAVGAISLVCGLASFYVWQVRQDSAVSASVEDDAPRAPLPAGPRKYQ